MHKAHALPFVYESIESQFFFFFFPLFSPKFLVVKTRRDVFFFFFFFFGDFIEYLNLPKNKMQKLETSNQLFVPQ